MSAESPHMAQGLVSSEAASGSGKRGAEQFGELLPETRRALFRRLAVGQAEGRAPSMTGADRKSVV